MAKTKNKAKAKAAKKVKEKQAKKPTPAKRKKGGHKGGSNKKSTMPVIADDHKSKTSSKSSTPSQTMKKKRRLLSEEKPNSKKRKGRDPPSPKRKKKKKEPKFRLKLPRAQNEVPYRNVPWHNCQDVYTAVSLNENPSSSSSSWCHVLYESDALDDLTMELESFAAYVRLLPYEYEARTRFLDHMQDLVSQTFSSPDRSHVRIDCFGSHATQEICCFLSDVDMALWGVVPIETTPTHTRFVHIDDDENDEAPETRKEPRVDMVTAAAKQREARVQKWRDAFAATDKRLQEEEEDDDSSLFPDDGEDGDKEKDTDERKSDNDDNNDEEDVIDIVENEEYPENDIGQQLFVIDRAGDEEEKNDDENAEQSNHEPNHLSTEGKPNDGGGRDSPEIIDLVDSDDTDSADKVEGFDRRRDNSVSMFHSDEENSIVEVDDEESEAEEPPRKARCLNGGGRRAAAVPLIENDEDGWNEEYQEDNENDEDEVLEVSFVRGKCKNKTLVVGPTGKTRQLVKKALYQLAGRLRKKSFMTKSVEVRAQARVPIICISTTFGFDGDVALGGHNGTDTSHFCQAQVQKFRSFAAVVLFLKILLFQQDLDKPFTGGIGSFKLYVLVAYHLEEYVSNGGRDCAGEVLLSFLYRFGAPSSPSIKGASRMRLTKDSVVKFGDIETDLSSVFKMEYCVEMFAMVWERLTCRLWEEPSTTDQTSFLTNVIDARKLQTIRGQSGAQTKDKTPTKKTPTKRPPSNKKANTRDKS